MIKLCRLLTLSRYKDKKMMILRFIWVSFIHMEHYFYGLQLVWTKIYFVYLMYIDYTYYIWNYIFCLQYFAMCYFRSFARTNFLLGMHGHVVGDAKYIRNKSIQTQHLQDCHHLSDKVTFSVIVFCFLSKSLFASSNY